MIDLFNTIHTPNNKDITLKFSTHVAHNQLHNIHFGFLDNFQMLDVINIYWHTKNVNLDVKAQSDEKWRIAIL